MFIPDQNNPQIQCHFYQNVNSKFYRYIKNNPVINMELEES